MSYSEILDSLWHAPTAICSRTRFVSYCYRVLRRCLQLVAYMGSNSACLVRHLCQPARSRSIAHLTFACLPRWHARKHACPSCMSLLHACKYASEIYQVPKTCPQNLDQESCQRSPSAAGCIMWRDGSRLRSIRSLRAATDCRSPIPRPSTHAT
jgi:hypothetical protein